MKADDLMHENMREIAALRWGGNWTQDEIQLVFANQANIAALALDPKAIKRLRDALQKWLINYEALEGSLWSENHSYWSAQNDLRLFGNDDSNGVEHTRLEFPTNSTAAKKLYLTVRNLPLDGCERSFKMLPGALLPERFLVGLPLSAIASADVRAIANDLHMPAALHDQFTAALPHAIYLHAGFEQGMRESTYKLYLEFAESAGIPLYLGYKWDTQNSAHSTISRYVRQPCLSIATMKERIGKAYGDTQAASALAAARMLELATLRLPLDQHDQLLFVDVSDEGSPRHSFDINLYPATISVRDLQVPLRNLAMQFNLPDEKFEALMQLVADDLVGHISGGIDRHGQPFLTVYHARPD